MYSELLFSSILACFNTFNPTMLYLIIIVSLYLYGALHMKKKEKLQRKSSSWNPFKQIEETYVIISVLKMKTQAQSNG